jgi:hypothetical protein
VERFPERCTLAGSQRLTTAIDQTTGAERFARNKLHTQSGALACIREFPGVKAFGRLVYRFVTANEPAKVRAGVCQP